MSKSSESDSEVSKRVVKKFVDFYTPSEEDVERKFTVGELEELCRRVPCRVEMSRWNMVNDYAQRFHRENRLQNKTPYQVNRLLEKAVNRYKANDYTQAEKQLAYKKEWLQRKRDNFLRLRLWHHDSRTVIADLPAEDVACDLLPIASPSSPTVSQADVACASESAQVFEEYMNVNTESMSVSIQSSEFQQELQSQPSELLPYEVFERNTPRASTPHYNVEM